MNTKRIFLRKKKRLNGLILFILIFLITVLISLFFISKNFNKVFKDYAKVETKKFLSIIINNTVTDNFLDNFEKENGDLFIENRNSENKVESVDLNRKVANKFLNHVVKSVEDSLIKIENGDIHNISLPTTVTQDKYKKLKRGIVVEVPSGIALNNSLLSNIAPKVPVKVHLAGNVLGNIDLKVEDYGINNLLIKVYIELVIEEEIVLPTVLEKVTTSYDLLVDTKLIHGQIPDYYLNNDLYTSD